MEWPSIADAPLADALQRIRNLEAQLAQSQQEASDAKAAIEKYKQEADDAKAAAAEAYQSMEQAFAANESSAAQARLLEQEVQRMKGTPPPAQPRALLDLGGAADASPHATNAFGGSSTDSSSLNTPGVAASSRHDPWGENHISETTDGTSK